MKIKILNNGIKIPTKAYQGDAGFDVYAPERIVLFPQTHKQIKLGLMIEINQNEVCVMSERSGMAIKNGTTSIGNIIDSGYRGEISLGQEIMLKALSTNPSFKVLIIHGNTDDETEVKKFELIKNGKYITLGHSFEQLKYYVTLWYRWANGEK